MGKLSVVPYLLIGMFVCGCQHTHLRSLTLKQASTITDLQYQQVVENLALVSVNPDALPHFAIPTGGQSQVDTAGTASFDQSWPDLTRVLHLEGQRATSGFWSLEPVNDTDKLLRMQCAYRKALGFETCQFDCQCCDAVFQEFYGAEMACRLPRCGWFGVGTRKDVPRDACYSGSYCGTYVWVCPEGLGELTRLTSAILDFAQRTPDAPASATAKWTAVGGDPANGFRITEYESVVPLDSIGSGKVPEAAGFAPGSEGGPTLPAPPRTFKDKGFAPGFFQRAIPLTR